MTCGGRDGGCRAGAPGSPAGYVAMTVDAGSSSVCYGGCAERTDEEDYLFLC
jgi:hypothetical protein